MNYRCIGRSLTERVDELLGSISQNRGIFKKEAAAGIIHQIPAGRRSRPGDLGKLAAFPSSHWAGYTTGVSILIDGGLFRGAPSCSGDKLP